MTVLPMSTTTTTTPTTSTTQTNNTSTTSQDSSPDDVNEDEFLQLLVAQIQYQDPTNPTDSTAFVTQLAQFSSLEQLVAIRGDLDTLTQAAGSSTTTSTSTIQGGN